MRRYLPLILLLTLLAPATASAHAHTPTKCVVPRLTGLTLPKARTKLKDAHCTLGTITGARAGKIITQSPKAGRRVKRGTKVTVALKATAATLPAPAPKVSYSTSVDPTFVQNPANPLAVTYTYSADATQTVNDTTTDLASIGQLPAGILNFYSGGTLVCSINVGGSNGDGTCPVTYTTTGTYQVTTEYVPNSATAVTETDTETINPFATVTTLATAVGAVQGNYFNIGIAWNVTGPSGDLITLSSSLVPTYTITDETTGQTIGTFAGNAGVTSCYITDAANGGGTYFDGDTCWNGDAGYPGDLSATDDYELTVTFPGVVGYDASISMPQVI